MKLERSTYQKPLSLTGLGGGATSLSLGAAAADLGLSDSYWFAPYGPGTLGTPHGYGIAIDHNDGSVYAICQHSGALGSNEALLFKFDKSGTMQWRRYLSGNGQEYFKNVAVDSDGNVYISGYSNNSTYGSQTFTTYVQTSGTTAWDISGFDRNGTVNGLNPTINIEAGDTMQFSMLNTTGHSFNMQTSPGSGASQVPSSTGPNYGVNRNGATSGYITFYTGGLTSGTYYYHCYNHGLMGGTVVVHPANTYGYAGYGQDDIILAKYNSSGDLQWQRTFGGAQYERQEKGLKVDSSGNVYVQMYGWFNAAGTYVSNYSMGFAKFDSSGNLLLQRAVGYSNWEFYGTGLDVDSSGNIYVCGRNPGSGSSPYAGYYFRPCGVISKWNSSGTWQWTYTLSYSYVGHGEQELNLYNILVDDSGNIYGSGTITAVGNWAGTSTSQLFLIKINSSGNKVWAKRWYFHGTISGQYSDLALDSEGNLMVSAEGYNIINGNRSALIFKFNPSNGSKIWSRMIDNTFHSNNVVTVSDDRTRGIAIDADDNFYINGDANGSGAGLGLVAKLPGDGSLFDDSAPGSSGTGIPTKFGARFLYKEEMNQSGYYYVDNDIASQVTLNSDTTLATGFTPQLQARASNLTSIDATGQAVSVGIISDRSTPDATYDYSFPDEVHYGNGSSGSGGSISYHYSGDGTMPAMNLGSSVQNFDMFFELYISKKDLAVSAQEFIICTNGYTSTNGWLFTSYGGNASNKEITIGDPNGYSLYTGHPIAYDTPQSNIDNKQYTDQWNWFKLEWRGGTSFKIYHKNSPTKSYTQSVTNMDTPVPIYTTTSNVYNGTDLNYLSIGAGQNYTGSGFYHQFYGRMKNFGINVNSNVVDL